MASFSHLFDSQAKSYAAFRPSYEEELYDHIYSYMGPGVTEFAVDVATGSGQAAVDLAKRFDKVQSLFGTAVMPGAG